MRKNSFIFLVALLCIKILQSHSMNRSFRLIGTSRKTTSTAVVDPRHLKVEVADHDFPNYFPCYKWNLPISNVNYANKEY